jgi:repressor LexA
LVKLKDEEHMDTERPELTAKQAQVLDFIRQHSAFYGPAIREIAAGLQIRSPNGVVCHLDALERKGYISRKRGVARGIEVVS